MRATTNPRRLAARVAAVGIAAFTLSSCSSSLHPAATLTTSGTSAKAVDGCTLITAAELSQAVGVHYTGIQDSGGTLCNVAATSPTDAFSYSVQKEGPSNTWAQEIAGIKRDDGSESSVPGIGDRAVQGAVKEFAAESHGYIVFVFNADANNPATSSTFARTKKIAQLLISKL